MDGDANELQQQIEQRVGKLPEDIQQAILSSDFGDKILAIGSTSKLHIDQIQNLNDISMLAMLGFMPLEQMEEEISTQLAIAPDMAKKVGEEINTQIFLPIRESMKKFAAGETTPTEAATSPTSASAPSSARQPLSEVLPKGPVAASMPETPVSPVKSSSTPAPVEPQVAPTAPASPTAPLPVVQKADMHPADIALTQKTVSLPIPPASAPTPAAPAVPAKAADANAVPPKPTDYKADPYREPIS